MRWLLFVVAALAVLLGLLLSRPGAAQPFVGRAAAPEFPKGLDWINTDRPLSLAELEGKAVVLDFWTYGCINCIHVIPDLQALEQKYGDALVVIGVHSAKFVNESQTENIRQVSERYGRTHPVVNDSSFVIWKAYGIAAWPSFVLIDPEGHILGRHVGEGVYDAFDTQIAGMIDAFTARGTLDRTPLELGRGSVIAPRTPLRFPGKVVADAAGQRLFIADSGQNRIVLTDLDGNVIDVIGNGDSALTDGPFQSAAFNAPQGMALAGPDTLYVADTGNHALRLVDLQKRTVTTVAGTGAQEYLFGRSTVPASGGLNSPWDVLWLNGQLYVAMAGQHQLWRYDPGSATLQLHAGSGREVLQDGVALMGGLNQPSGLATDGTVLFVADPEASAIRQVDAVPGGNMSTLVGTGLFDFGDVDGMGDATLLQHPLGVEYADGFVYVADTYNHKIKRLDPATRQIVTLVGTGEEGWADGATARFWEPGGLSLAADQLYVADTNNHAVRRVDLHSLQVSTLSLTDPDGKLGAQRQASTPRYDELIDLPLVTVAAGQGTVQLRLSLPPGYVANQLAPLQIDWAAEGSVALQGAPHAAVSEPDYPLTLEQQVTFTPGQGSISADVLIYYCREVATELCLIRQARLQAPVTVTEGGGSAQVIFDWRPPPLPPGY
jgi:thiol-disulfide isomerase/thioredoxin